MGGGRFAAGAVSSVPGFGCIRDRPNVNRWISKKVTYSMNVINRTSQTSSRPRARDRALNGLRRTPSMPRRGCVRRPAQGSGSKLMTARLMLSNTAICNPWRSPPLTMAYHQPPAMPTGPLMLLAVTPVSLECASPLTMRPIETRMSEIDRRASGPAGQSPCDRPTGRQCARPSPRRSTRESRQRHRLTAAAHLDFRGLVGPLADQLPQLILAVNGDSLRSTRTGPPAMQPGPLGG
jgi:hypothetical protein